MKKLLYLASVVLLFVLARPARAEDGPSLNPFDQGAELDAACGSSGVCYREFGTKNAACTATGYYGGCYQCGRDPVSWESRCSVTWNNASCYCKLYLRQNSAFSCWEEGQCSYSY